jgi:cell wall-associated NlpC family hydrolase
MVEMARRYVGMSKEDLGGMDCSAFLRLLGRLAGVPVDSLIECGKGPNGCSRLMGSLPCVPEGEAKTGDLVFFKIDNDPAKTASHVGLLIINDDGSRQILHMSNAGVRLNDFSDKAVRGSGSTWADKMVPGGIARLP